MISDNQTDAGFYLFIKQIENSLDSFSGFKEEPRYHDIYNMLSACVNLSLELLPDNINIEVK